MNGAMGTGSRLDVTGSLGPAWERMVLMLFTPSDVGKWFAIGFIVFLEMLVQYSGSGVNFPGGSGSPSSGTGPSSPADFADMIDEGIRWVQDHLDMVLGIGVPVVLLGLGLFALFLWLAARAQLMFVRVVARNDAAIGDNWRATRYLVGSLFKVRLVIEAATMTLVIGGLCALGYVLYRLFRRNETDWKAYVFELGTIAAAWIVLSFLPHLVNTLLRNFVVPVMLKHQESCTESFRRMVPVFSASVAGIVVFLLLRFAFHLAFGFANLLVVLLTCCIGGLPVVNQAVTAPFHVFDRAWSMYALRALGPEFDLFAEPVAPAASQLPPARWGQPNV